MKLYKSFLLIFLICFAQNLFAQWTQGGDFSEPFSLKKKNDGTGRELTYNFIMPDDTSKTAMGFSFGLDGRLLTIPVGFIINNIEWKLGGAFSLSFMSTTMDYKRYYFSDTLRAENPVASFYTVYTPYIYTDLRFNFNKHIAIIPHAGYFYGFGSIIYQDENGATVSGAKENINPLPNGFLIGVTLKISSFGVSFRKYYDNNLYNVTSICVGLKM